MHPNHWLAEQFETHRRHLHAVAFRMLGSNNEADDAVQDAWLRISRTDTSAVDNLGGWLTTVVARIALDMLRSRKARQEEPLSTQLDDAIDAGNPEHEAILADSVGPALMAVLDTLAPAERIAFVLHDMFGMSFEEIAPIVDRNAAAARQLASRGRRRIQGATAHDESDLERRRHIVAAFFDASRHGKFDALLALLDPDVVLRADAVAVATSQARQTEGAPLVAPEMRGVRSIADTFSGRARTARLAMVDGAPGAAWVPDGTTRAVFVFRIEHERIVQIELIADPEHIGRLELEWLTQ
jgi:RNA polymerase sigma-70 factor (ECF subfamily)